jgi:hypothetical protein
MEGRLGGMWGDASGNAAAAAAEFIAAASRSADEDPVDEDGCPLMTHVVASRIVREAGGYRAPQVGAVQAAP